MIIMNISALTSDAWNELLMEIMQKKYIIRIFLKNDSSPRFMLIRNKVELVGKFGLIPWHAIQGEDITYEYNYGKFYNNKKLTYEQNQYYNSIFHGSGHIVFGESISHIIIYKSEEKINAIDNEMDRNIIRKLHSDIKSFNWEPKIVLPY
jgi:hypothetical protein